MAYIPKTHIWASKNGKEIFYQDSPPSGINAVLIANRGAIVNPFFVKKYGLQEQQAQPEQAPVMPDVETVAEIHHTSKSAQSEEPVNVDKAIVETKVVEPENSEKQFKKQRKNYE